MSLIHTCQLCGANSFDYLTELQRHPTVHWTGPILLILGRRGRNRTCNPRIRNPMLYPFELRALKRLSVSFYNVTAIAAFAVLPILGHR